MKRTDQERIERELKRREKHARVPERLSGEATPPAEGTVPPTGGLSVSEYVRNLLALLHYDDQQIYNARDDESVFELLLTMKADLPEKQWETVLRSAVQKTKVVEKELALTELRALLAD
jgi:hypothetical protein